MAANFNNLLLFNCVTADTGNTDYTMLRTGDIHNALSVANGATAGTCQFLNGTSPITDAMNVNAGANTLTRATTINDASNTLAIGDTLRVTKSAAVATWTLAAFSAPGPNS